MVVAWMAMGRAVVASVAVGYVVLTCGVASVCLTDAPL